MRSRGVESMLLFQAIILAGAEAVYFAMKYLDFPKTGLLATCYARGVTRFGLCLISRLYVPMVIFSTTV